MLGLVARRLVQMPLILLAIYAITVVLAWGIPGNPLEKPEGRRPPPEVQEAMLRQYNLHSLPAFAVSYLDSALGVRWARETLGGEAARREAGARAAGSPAPARRVFDLGPSLQNESWRVNEIIASSLPVSVSLGLAAIVIALVVGVTAGVVGAVRPNSLADLTTLTLSLAGVSLPSFVIGEALLLVFGVWLAWVPVGSWGHARDFALPSITLSLPFAAYIARLTRMGMLEHLRSDFIRTARAKGVPEARVLLKHALKNAMLPVLSFLGPACAMAMTGSFVVEKVFVVPGLGQHFVGAVLNKDLFLIMGVVLVFSTMLILFNLAVDVLYRWVDPRIE